MKNLFRRKEIVALSALLFLVLTPSTQAQDATVSPINTLKELLTGMGFDPQISGNGISIKDGNFLPNFFVSSDKSTLYAYEAYNVKPEQSPRAPLLQMLSWNNSHIVYFSVRLDSKNLIDIVEINESAAMKGMSPMVLKGIIDDLKKVDTEQQDLFNPYNWK